MNDTEQSAPGRIHGRLYTYRVSMVAALGGLLFGFDTAIINGAIVFVKRQFTARRRLAGASAGPANRSARRPMAISSGRRNPGCGN